MSELSIAELQAESVELLPERETLSIIQVNIGSATAIGAFGGHATAVNDQTNVAAIVGSYNFHLF